MFCPIQFQHGRIFFFFGQPATLSTVRPGGPLPAARSTEKSQKEMQGPFFCSAAPNYLAKSNTSRSRMLDHWSTARWSMVLFTLGQTQTSLAVAGK